MEATLSHTLDAGPLQIRMKENVALVDERPLQLTRHEFDLLIALARRPGAVIGRQELASDAWARPLRAGDRSVDVYVRRLRQKLAAEAPEWDFIHTHFAFGYRFGAERSQLFHMDASSS